MARRVTNMNNGRDNRHYQTHQQVSATHWHPYDCDCDSCCRTHTGGHRGELCVPDSNGYISEDDSINDLEDELWRNNTMYYNNHWSNRQPQLPPTVGDRRRQEALQEKSRACNGLFSRTPSPSDTTPLPHWDVRRQPGSFESHVTHNGFIKQNGIRNHYGSSDCNGVDDEADLIIVDSDGEEENISNGNVSLSVSEIDNWKTANDNVLKKSTLRCSSKRKDLTIRLKDTIRRR